MHRMLQRIGSCEQSNAWRQALADATDDFMKEDGEVHKDWDPASDVDQAAIAAEAQKLLDLMMSWGKNNVKLLQYMGWSKSEFDAKMEEGYEHFLLNLDNVKIIDSCGVGLIIVANNVTSSRSCGLYLSNIKPFIVKIFEIMRISKHLAIYDQEDDALQAIKNNG